MKKFLLFVASLLGINLAAQPSVKSFYELKGTTIDGKEFDFATLKGKKVLIVNTASECGYTPQYEDLEKLFKKYGGKNFTIVGFPANNFGAQEPGTNKDIAEFCKKNYGVSFTMMSKVSVKGSDIDPVYQWLTQKTLNGVKDAEIRWNFWKFAIDENGKWCGDYSSKVKPMDEELVKWITGK